MSEIWQRLVDFQNSITNKISEHAEEYSEPGMERFNHSGWVNRVWRSDNIRRAHLDVVDARTTRGLWMMHFCLFPSLTNTAPIYGVDVIAGKSKVTGFFHDFSPGVDHSHTLIREFSESVEQYEWKKQRQLPEWALQIFSPYMVAAGNINEINELESLIELSYNNLCMWLSSDHSGDRCSPSEGKLVQNRYAFYQKQNPHTPKTMTALGLDEESVKLFVSDCLFPDID